MFIMPHAWHFSDHWGFDLSVSHLDLVARRENVILGGDIDQLNEGMAFFSCRREPCQWMAGSNPNLFASGRFEISNVRACCRRGHKKYCAFPEGFRIPSFYRSTSAVFGPLTWNLNVVVAMNCRGRRLQCWSFDSSECCHAFNALRYSDPGYAERSWRWFNNEFGGEA